jgi:hypothetical protein
MIWHVASQKLVANYKYCVVVYKKLGCKLLPGN